MSAMTVVTTKMKTMMILNEEVESGVDIFPLALSRKVMFRATNGDIDGNKNGAIDDADHDADGGVG